jgi:hypothetical protein
LIAVTGGTWNISGLSSTNKFNINLWSLSGLPDTTGAPLNFNASGSYSWKILDAVGLAGSFDTNLFSINTGAFNGTGGFVESTELLSLALDGNNDLFLTYQGGGTPIPEPGTWAVATLLALGAGYIHRRRSLKAAKSVLGLRRPKRDRLSRPLADSNWPRAEKTLSGEKNTCHRQGFL